MKKQILVLSSILLLSSCTTTVVEVEETPVIHPTLPKPIQPVNINIKTVVLEDNSYFIMGVGDMQRLRIYMNNMLKYIKNSNDIICSYRKELKETHCERNINEK